MLALRETVVALNEVEADDADDADEERTGDFFVSWFLCWFRVTFIVGAALALLNNTNTTDTLSVLPKSSTACSMSWTNKWWVVDVNVAGVGGYVCK